MPTGYTTRPTRRYTADEMKLRKMAVLSIQYLNNTRAFIEAFEIMEDPEQKIKDEAYWYKTASRVVASAEYKAIKKEYMDSIYQSKDEIRQYAREVMKRIVKKTEDEQSDTAVRAVALLAKVSGIDTDDKEKNSNITINFTNGRQET